MPNSGYNATRNEQQADTALNLRRLEFADLPNVAIVEARSFSSPWSSGMFALEMSKPDSLCLVATPIDDQDVIFGYIVFSKYDLAWHLMNVAVSPEHRRLGIATILIEEVLRIVGRSAPVTLEVRPSNQAAIALYEGLGFDSYGFRKGYYPDNGEDALIMWRGDPSAAGVPGESRPIDRHRRPRPARLKPSGV
jgi:[ribosomal protein S18]-alanine N-acetyltransferase